MSDVRADIVGTVFSVDVAEGQVVEVGDTLVVLESMKMEIPVLAETSGPVSRLVAAGTPVQEGDLLAVIG